MKSKSRSDSIYTQILNYRPHWNLLSELADTPQPSASVEGYSPNLSKLDHKDYLQNDQADRENDLSRFHTLNNLSRLEDLEFDHMYENVRLRSDVQSRPDSLTILAPKRTLPLKFTPDSPFQNIYLSAELKSWYENALFSPKTKLSPNLILRDLDRDLNYYPHALLYESHVKRLKKVAYTPTFHKTIDRLCDTICFYSNSDHACSPPRPEFWNIHGSPISDTNVLPSNIGSSCFSLLSVPLSNYSYEEDNVKELKLDDFIQTPGPPSERCRQILNFDGRKNFHDSRNDSAKIGEVKYFSSSNNSSSKFSFCRFPLKFLRRISNLLSSQDEMKFGNEGHIMNRRYDPYPRFENVTDGRSFSPIREHTMDDIYNQDMGYEPYYKDRQLRRYPDGDEVLKIVSNCDNDDGLLSTLLRDDVSQIEKRLLFYFKQLNNVKYSYDIVEKVR